MVSRLSLKDVSYSYPFQDAMALSGINLETRPGEVFCIAGSNGSGKSTLAQICAGLLTPTSGSVLYDGKPARSGSRLLNLHRNVGLLFQSPEDQLFADTVRKDIEFGPRNQGLRGDDLAARVIDAARLVGLPLQDTGGRSPFSLSEGEKRRVALAGVLAMNPEILVLDEPFIGLDHDGREHLISALSSYVENKLATIVLVTHDLSGAWPLASRFALLSESRLVGIESKADLVLGNTDMLALGVRLPQWGVLAKELLHAGIPVEDPSDPSCLAKALVRRREVRDDR
ncbi:MAG: energy-coupling factor ABC transporter ATP-binding protein [Actinobacteria bacterium]|nr:energy-coupling factor ABC transporter ATP-binding protein [Actinomycetota bacterium]MCG2818949.1 energy-coupling factor ABC transporter ATP-binding protein [Actinomycetes bacterium]MBU4219510.1 energy-coupling factor ABC transporter ATP-binding protein [Actinomycetota bacterium]MBU4359130.1 energy-coupling factor ABC transporter ATP-binding protein [Actinomycetota bacterium]MBU4392719.1 energy-coupling factor ABC transporter ATP-binding protein [Actinomycetota bacterium]